MTVESEALIKALERVGGDLDTTLESLLVTWMGQYEEPSHAQDWNGRNAIYARNGMRKMVKERFRKWMDGKEIF